MNTPELEMANGGAVASNDQLGHIRVRYSNEIFGEGVLWQGAPSELRKIPNIPARELAKLVAKDGKARSYGMWHVSMLPDANAESALNVNPIIKNA